MKYEIIKGSEKDFEGAPESALVKIHYKDDEDDFVFAEKFELAAKFWHADGSLGPLNGYYNHGTVIAERRPITEPVANQQLTTEWDGCGVPSVGSKVMTKSGEGIIDYVGSGVIVYSNNDGQWSVRCDSIDYSLSAIRSPEDVARDEAVDAIKNKLLVRREVAESFYDFIANGNIPTLCIKDT